MNPGAIFILTCLLSSSVDAGSTIRFRSTGNPVLADGSVYSADPAPLVVNDTVYILSGRDEAGPAENAFIMNEWQVFEARDPDPKGGDWVLHGDVVRPHDVFRWAAEGSAYAGQIVQAANGNFYLYAPVRQAKSATNDPFAIGVAVANSPLGPFKDAHPSGPIISQSVPAPGNDIQNIDPTVLVDTDGRVFIYFGTFGRLKGYELDKDMTTIKGSVVTVDTLTGFFEAPWIMKRNSVYYMLYAANNAGADSPCTPTSYHACLAYGTASSPLGPWTFRGVFLGIVSATTSHPGAYQLGDDWFLVYHTRDADGGTHFRRSIAFDKLEWNNSTNPPSIQRVKQTHRPSKPRAPSRNIAPLAKASSSIQTPIQYWDAAINDERVEAAPLPPDMWSSYKGDDSPQNSALTYTWESPVELNGTSVVFFADQDAGSNIGVPPPDKWRIEYLDASTWKAVETSDAYPLEVTDDPKVVSFKTIKTTNIRLVLSASGRNGQFGGVGVKEWKALAPKAQ